MDKKSKIIRIMIRFLMLAFLAVWGCGGGGDSATDVTNDGDDGGTVVEKVISGVAAAGAPIIGTVTIKDSEGTEEVTEIEADGSYSIDVSGLVAPFAFRADGYVGAREYHLYSAAVESDINNTINITPFTDLIIANIAGDIAENYYNSGNFSNLTSDEVEEAETALQEKLQPVLTAMGLDSSIDLLRTSFNTDHTGLDAVIDVVKVSVDPDTVQATLTNIINLETISMNIAEGGSTDNNFTDSGVSDGVTAIQAITTGLNAFAGLFATSLPDPDNTTLRGLFDADTFIESGSGLDAFLTQLTSDGSMIGISFGNVVVNSLDLDTNICEFSFSVMQNGQVVDGPDAPWIAVKKGDRWLIQGDLRIARVAVQAHARYFPNMQDNQFQTGLSLEIETYGLAGSDVQSAIVTGPGLPEAGIVLNRQIENEWFAIAGTQWGDNLYVMGQDASIGAIPENAEYTICLYDSADGQGTILATYTDMLPRRPLKNSELSSTVFPAITSPTANELAAFTGGSLTISWTMPSGLTPDWINLMLFDSNYYNSESAEADLNATDTSKTLTIDDPPFQVAYSRIYLTATDMHDRSFQIER